MLIPGKVAIITGAAQGIGKALAESFLQREGKVCLADVDEERGNSTLAEFKGRYGSNSCIFFKCDVTNKAQFRELFKYAHDTFERIDVLCNNAGICDNSFDNFDRTININLTGMITGCMMATESFKEDGGGVIINVASAGAFFPIPSQPVYAASKWGILGYSKSLALAPGVKDIGIRVNILCPAFVKTAMTQDPAVVGNEAVKRAMDEAGLLEPEQVAEGFIELVEDDTKHGAALMITKKDGFQYL